MRAVVPVMRAVGQCLVHAPKPSISCKWSLFHSYKYCAASCLLARLNCTLTHALTAGLGTRGEPTHCTATCYTEHKMGRKIKVNERKMTKAKNTGEIGA